MAQIATITNPLTGQPAQVDQLDHTAQEIDDGIARALPGGAIDQRVSMLPGQNLLDNSVFIDGCLVDQRQGYVVPPGEPYYIAGISTPSGYLSTYTSVHHFINDGANPVIVLDGTTYVCDPHTAVRGYTGAGPTIDRWCNATGDKTVLITEGGLYFPVASDFFSNLDLDLYGKTITYSVLTDKGIISITATMPNTAPSTITEVATGTVSGIGSINMYARDPSSAPVTFHISFFFDAGVTAHAVKLELGSQQTLAHQDSSGNWVLNDLPNYADTLARCQYYHREGYVNAWLPRARDTESPKYSMTVNFPKMRTAPAVTLYDGNGNRVTSQPSVAVFYPESFTVVSDVETVLFKYVLNSDL